MNFVRDIAIPVVLLLAVGAIITSVNFQLTSFANLTPQSNVLIIRDTSVPIEDSQVPFEIINELNQPNIDSVAPIVYQHLPFVLNNNTAKVTSSASFIFTNLSIISNILSFTSFSKYQVDSLNQSSIIIGSNVLNTLQLNSNELNNYQFDMLSSNVSLHPQLVLKEPDEFVNSILVNINELHAINKTYNYNYYSEILLNVKDRNNIVKTQNQIQILLTKAFPSCNCKVIQGTGTSFLFTSILDKIIEQINIFNVILSLIIVVRILQTLLWISHDFEYELKELKIIGTSKIQLYILFILISFVIGNLGLILGIMGSIVIPPILTYLISILTFQTVSIQAPSVIQLIISVFIFNVLIIVTSLIPAYILSSKKDLKIKTREQ